MYRARAVATTTPSEVHGDKVFHPLELSHCLIGQKEPNLHRSWRVTGGGILVIFNILFTIQIFAFIFPPPSFFLGVT